MAVRSPQLVSDTIFWRVTQKGIEGLTVYCIDQLVFNLVGIVNISAKPHDELGMLRRYLNASSNFGRVKETDQLGQTNFSFNWTISKFC